MRHFLAVTATVVLCSCLLSAADKALDGVWWSQMSPAFKLGWVSGYAKAMDLAGTLQMASCAAEMPMYQKQFPDVNAKEILQKMCLSNTTFDYDGIAMGQFVDGMDTFFKDYRNRQLEVGWAIQYVRDEIKGKPARELESEVAMWRRCSAATQTGNTEQISKACTPDDASSDAAPKK
jgi:hypothetical protein